MIRLVQFLIFQLKTPNMKKIFLPALLLCLCICVSAQDNKTEMLQNLEGNNVAPQDQGITAKLKNASRLFKDKDDLTSVIMVIPADSIVEVLDSDSSFLRVWYEDNEGYIYANQAIVNRPEKVTKPAPIQEQQSQANLEMKRIEPKQGRTPDRYTYLANKYSAPIADKLYGGKIWRGMSNEMVEDAWGNPKKINRIISGSNDTKEEWVYTHYWLSFSNGVLIGWGPMK
jgi:hypothetical protein